MATVKRYAKTQSTWLQNKLAPKLLTEWNDNKQAGMWILDSSFGLTDELFKQAEEIVKGFISHETIPHPTDNPLGYLLIPSSKSMAKLNPEDKRMFTCEVCKDRESLLSIQLPGKLEWEKHLDSKRHKSALQRIKLYQENRHYRAATTFNEERMDN